jgi:hypothetical protein
MEKLVHRKYQFAIILALLLCRIVLLLASPTKVSGDGQGYIDAARHIASTWQLPPLRVQPHGLPIILTPLVALFGPSVERPLLWLHVAMDSAILCAMIALTYRIFSNTRHFVLRFITCLAILLQPFTATMATSVYSEQSCQFLIFFGILFLHISTQQSANFLFSVLGPIFLGFAGLLRADVLILNLFIVFSFNLIYYKHTNNFFVNARRLLTSLSFFAIFPLTFLIFQYSSTGELGFVKAKFHNPGYMSWMRTWFAYAHYEHDKFAFGPGTPGWSGFDVNAYPSRAFDSETERSEVNKLIKTWLVEGYTEPVDLQFKRLAEKKAREHPLRNYCLLPILRMCHFWLNIDGAQTFLRTVPIKRPLSTCIVLFAVTLRIIFVLSFFSGLFVAYFRFYQLEQIGELTSLIRLAAIAVIFRTVELGLLGPFVWAGLMEVRYVTIVFPQCILVASLGILYYQRICTNKLKAGFKTL